MAVGALLHRAQWRNHQDSRPGAATPDGAALEVRDGQVVSAHTVDGALARGFLKLFTGRRVAESRHFDPSSITFEVLSSLKHRF